MASTSGSGLPGPGSSCPGGYRNDDFMQYIVPSSGVCYLNQQTHYVLAAVWVALIALLLIELLSGRYLRMIPSLKNLTAPAVTPLEVHMTLLYTGALIIWAMVLHDPLVSVHSSPQQNAGLWLGIFLNQWGYIGYLVSKGILGVRPLLTSLGIGNAGKSLNTLSNNSGSITNVHAAAAVSSQASSQSMGEEHFFAVARHIQILQMVVYWCGSLVCFVILPNVVTDLAILTRCVMAGFILFGLCFIWNTINVAAIQLRIRDIALRQISFNNDLPTSDSRSEQTLALSLMARRMLLSSIYMLVFAIMSAFVWLLLVSIIPFNWVVVHCLYGGYVVFAGVVSRSNARDSFLCAAICCRFNFDATPHSSSVGKNSHPSEDTSQKGNKDDSTSGVHPTPGRHNPMNRNPAGAVGVDSHNRKPSKMLETVDMNELNGTANGKQTNNTSSSLSVTAGEEES